MMKIFVDFIKVGWSLLNWAIFSHISMFLRSFKVNVQNGNILCMLKFQVFGG